MVAKAVETPPDEKYLLDTLADAIMPKWTETSHRMKNEQRIFIVPIIANGHATVLTFSKQDLMIMFCNTGLGLDKHHAHTRKMVDSSTQPETFYEITQCFQCMSYDVFESHWVRIHRVVTRKQVTKIDDVYTYLIKPLQADPRVFGSEPPCCRVAESTYFLDDPHFNVGPVDFDHKTLASQRFFMERSPHGAPPYTRLFALPQMTGSCTYSSMLWTLFTFMPSYGAVLRLENGIRWHTLQSLQPSSSRNLTTLEYSTERCIAMTMHVEHTGYHAYIRSAEMKEYISKLLRCAPLHEDSRRKNIHSLFIATKEDPTKWMLRSQPSSKNKYGISREDFESLIQSRRGEFKDHNLELMLKFLLGNIAVLGDSRNVTYTDKFVLCCLAGNLLNLLLSWTFLCSVQGQNRHLSLRTISHMAQLDGTTIHNTYDVENIMMRIGQATFLVSSVYADLYLSKPRKTYHLSVHVEQTPVMDTRSLCARCFSLLAVLNTCVFPKRAMPTSECANEPKDLEVFLKNFVESSSKTVPFTRQDLIHLASFRHSALLFNGNSLLTSCDSESPRVDAAMTYVNNEFEMNKALSHFPARAGILIAMLGISSFYSVYTIQIEETDRYSRRTHGCVVLSHDKNIKGNIYASHLFRVKMWLDDAHWLSVTTSLFSHSDTPPIYENLPAEKNLYASDLVMRMVHVPTSIYDVHVIRTDEDLRMYLNHTFHSGLQHIYKGSWSGDFNTNHVYKSRLALSFSVFAFMKWQEYSTRQVMMNDFTLLRFRTETNPISVAYLLLLYANCSIHINAQNHFQKKLLRIIREKRKDSKFPVWLQDALLMCEHVFRGNRHTEITHLLTRSLDIFDEDSIHAQVLQTLVEILLKTHPLAAYDVLDVQTGFLLRSRKNGTIFTFPTSLCFAGLHIDMLIREKNFESLWRSQPSLASLVKDDQMLGDTTQIFVSRNDSEKWETIHKGIHYTFGQNIVRKVDGATFLGSCPYHLQSLSFVVIKLDLASIPGDVWWKKDGWYQVETRMGIFIVRNDDIYWKGYTRSFTEKDAVRSQSFSYTDGCFWHVKRADSYEETQINTWTHIAKAAVFVVNSSLGPSTKKGHLSRSTDSLLLLTSSSQTVHLKKTPFDKDKNHNATAYTLKDEARILRMHPSYLYPDFGSCSPKEIVLLFMLCSASCKVECTARLWWSLQVIRLILTSSRKDAHTTMRDEETCTFSSLVNDIVENHIMGSPYRWMQPALTSKSSFLCSAERRERRVGCSKYFHRVRSEQQKTKSALGDVRTDDDATTHIHHRQQVLGKVNDLIRHAVPLSRMLLLHAPSDGDEKSSVATLDVVGNVQPLTQGETDVLLQECDSVIADERHMQSPTVEHENIIWPLTDFHVNEVILCRHILAAFHFNKLFRDATDGREQLEQNTAFKEVQRFHPDLLLNKSNGLNASTIEFVQDVMLFENSSCKFVNATQFAEAMRLVFDVVEGKRPIQQAIMGVGKSSVIIPLLCMLYARHATHLNMLVLVQPSHLVRDCLMMLFKSFSAIAACIKDVNGQKVLLRVLAHPNEASHAVLGDKEKRTERTFTIVCLDDVMAKNLWLVYKVKMERRDANAPEISCIPWNPSTTAVFFDEVDAMYDPLSAQLNIPEMPVEHPVLKTTEQMNALYSRVISTIKPDWAGDLPHTHADVLRILSTVRANSLSFLDKLDADMASATGMHLNLHFGDSHKLTSRFAVPYTAVNTPSPDSSFSDCDMTIILTCILKITEGLRPFDLARLQDFLREKLHLFTHIDGGVLNIIRRNFVKEACSIAQPNTLLNDGFLQMSAAQLHSHDHGSIARDAQCIRFYLLRVLLPSLRVHQRQWNLSFLDLMQADVCTHHMLGMSGTLRMRPVTCASFGERPKVVSSMRPSLFAQASIELIIRGYQDMGLDGPRAKRREDIVFSCSDIAKVLTYAKKYDCLIDACACLRSVDVQHVRTACAESRAFTFINERDERKTLLPSGEAVHSFTPTSAKDVFTFFDQKHSRGTDLVLHMRTRGLVILDGTNACISETAQAMFRLRQLQYGQLVDFCIFQGRGDSPRDGDELYNFLVRNEEKQMNVRSHMHDIQMWKAVVRTFQYGASHSENVPYILKTIDDPGSVLRAVSQTRNHGLTTSEDGYVSKLFEKAQESILALHAKQVYGENHNTSTIVEESTEKQKESEEEHVKKVETNGLSRLSCVGKINMEVVYEVNATGVSYKPPENVQNGELEKAMAILKIYKTVLVYQSTNVERMVFQYGKGETCVICAAVEVLVTQNEEDVIAMYDTSGTRVFCENCDENAVTTDARVLMACLFAGGKLSLVSHAHLVSGALGIDGKELSAIKSIIRCLVAEGMFDGQNGGVMKMWEKFARSPESTMRSLHSDLLQKCEDPVAFAGLCAETVTDEIVFFLQDMRSEVYNALSEL